MSQSTENEWIGDDPLDKNLARMIRANLVKLDDLAEDTMVKLRAGGLEGNEYTRLVRTAVSIREKAIRLCTLVMKEKVGNAIAERKKTVEA